MFLATWTMTECTNSRTVNIYQENFRDKPYKSVSGSSAKQATDPVNLLFCKNLQISITLQIKPADPNKRKVVPLGIGYKMKYE